MENNNKQNKFLDNFLDFTKISLVLDAEDDRNIVLKAIKYNYSNLEEVERKLLSENSIKIAQEEEKKNHNRKETKQSF